MTPPATARRPPSAPSPAVRLADLADRLARLRPDWHNPERFFEGRSDLAAELRAMAHDMAGRQ